MSPNFHEYGDKAHIKPSRLAEDSWHISVLPSRRDFTDVKPILAVGFVAAGVDVAGRKVVLRAAVGAGCGDSFVDYDAECFRRSWPSAASHVEVPAS